MSDDRAVIIAAVVNEHSQRQADQAISFIELPQVSQEVKAENSSDACAPGRKRLL